MIKLLLALLKFAKFGPALKSAAFMALSVGAYALLFGWRYALGFVLLMLVHEMGHYVAARRLGMNVGLPMFIPFVGAWIELKDQPMSVQQEAQIAFAGPFVGTLAAAAVLALALREHSALLLALAYAGFFLNLFNLIPISPFDGGRIVAILSPKVWFVGVPILVGAFIVIPSPMFLLILLLLAPTLYTALRAAWRGEVPAHNPRYYEVPLEARVRYASYYVLLLGFLCVMTFRTHAQIEAVRSL
ncbi:MAG TPA: site-2 protease family protein [Steroidobacteraceae bacterium]|jgi:Zn-dependent protease|nr:site-2 protease family protein [Steroidobacteraceae bacterium]